MAVSTDIQQKANDIRTKVKGEEVRENLASSLELMSSDINQFKEDVNGDNDDFKNDIGTRQTNLENTFNQEIANQTVANPSNSETVASRTDNVTNITYDTLGKRLDAHSSQLAENMKHKLNWFNAIEYGFKNDGINTNDTIMSNYIANDSDKILYFPSGIYVFAQGFNFPNQCHLKLDSTAELRLISDTILDYFITIRKDSTRSDYADGSFIDGGIINANNKANTGIGTYKCRYTMLENFILKNIVVNGIKTLTNTPVDGEITLKDLLLINETATTGTTGIFDNGFDTIGSNVEIVNFERAIYTVSGRFTNIKAWIKDSILLPNSIFAYIDGFDVTFDNFAVDTYRYGFKISSQSYSVLINNMLWITNSSVYTNDLQIQYPRIIFNADYPDRIYKVNGLKINNETNLSFSNINLTESSFINVKVPYQFNAYTNFANYRNDNDKLQNLKNYLGAPKPVQINKSTDFNTITTNGLYETDLYNGTGGANYPTMTSIGVLEVTNINSTTSNLIVQKFYGVSNFCYRVYVAGAWQAWNYYTKSA